MSGKLSSRAITMNTVLDTVSSLSSIASKVMSNPSSRTSKLGLGKETVNINGQRLIAIQQNPNKNSAWGALARQGKSVIQYKDTNNKYIGVSVDGVFTKY
jgi:hypothetical protein